MSSQLHEKERQSYQTLLNRGHDSAWAGNWEEAADAYRRAIAVYNGEPEAHTNLGLALFEQGKFREALEAYQEALQLSPGDVVALHKIADIHAKLGEKIHAASTYLLLGESYMQERQPAQAVRAWQQVVRYDPLNQTAYRRLAEAYRRGRRNDLAAQATLALARALAEMGDEDEAITAAEQALELQPDFGPAEQFLHQLKGTTPPRAPTGSLRRGTGTLRRPDADDDGSGPLDFASFQADGRNSPVMDEQVEGGLDPTELAQQRALARIAEGFFDEDSVDLNIEALKAKAVDLQTRGLVEEAARTFEEIIEGGGASIDVYFALGTLYQTMIRFEKAIQCFKRVYDTEDYALASRFALGQCYQSQGRTDEALQYFLEAVETIDMQAVSVEEVDQIVRVYEGVVDCYEAKGDQQQAKQVTDTLIDFLNSRGWEDKVYDLQARLATNGSENQTELVSPASSEVANAAVNASKQYQKQGYIQAALEEIYGALPHAPFYLPLHLQLADLYLAANRADDAVAKLIHIADVYLMRSNATQAIRVLKRALDISPVDQTVRGKLIDLLVSHGEIDEAVANYIQLAENFYQLAQGDRAVEKLNEALRLAPRGNPENDWSLKIQRRLADIHLQRLDWRKATTAFEAIYAVRPNDLDVVHRLSDLYLKLESPERAITVLTKAAKFLLETEGPDTMLEFMENQLNLRPDDPELIKLMGEMQAELQDVEGAAESWERAVELLVGQRKRSQAAALLRRIIALRSSREKRYRAMLDHLMKQQERHE